MHWTKTDENFAQCIDFKSRQFVTSQWQDTDKVSTVYVIYRWSVALFTFSVAIGSIALPKPGQTVGDTSWTDVWKWFIYATHWSYLVVVLQAFLGLVLVQKAALNQRCHSKTNGTVIKGRYFEDFDRNLFAASELMDPTQNVNQQGSLLFVLYRISFAAAFDMALSVTVMFWAIVFEPKDKPLDVLTFLLHGINSVLMVMEASLVRHLVLWWDAVASVAIGVAFVAFSVVYHVIGGTDHYGHPYIYRAMDWASWPKALAFGAGANLAIILGHCLLMVFQVLKRAVHRRWILHRVKIRMVY